jgi:hypothetical protein
MPFPPYTTRINTGPTEAKKSSIRVSSTRVFSLNRQVVGRKVRGQIVGEPLRRTAGDAFTASLTGVSRRSAKGTHTRHAHVGRDLEAARSADEMLSQRTINCPLTRYAASGTTLPGPRGPEDASVMAFITTSGTV